MPPGRRSPPADATVNATAALVAATARSLQIFWLSDAGEVDGSEACLLSSAATMPNGTAADTCIRPARSWARTTIGVPEGTLARRLHGCRPRPAACSRDFLPACQSISWSGHLQSHVWVRAGARRRHWVGDHGSPLFLRNHAVGHLTATNAYSLLRWGISASAPLSSQAHLADNAGGNSHRVQEDRPNHVRYQAETARSV
jgi:hypothetical protein